MVCTKTLYNYVEQGLLPIRNIDLPLKVRRKTRSSGIRRNKRILGTSIEERPCQVNDRTEFGHWEIDTVIGRKTKGEAVLLTLTERKTREEVIRKLPEKSAEAVMDSLQNLARTAGDLFPVVFKSITADNGSEFSDLALLEECLGPKVYFAHPYRSGERGTNEVHNGLIRRFIPKGKSLSDYSTSSLERIQQWCNSLHRKVLGYQTPHEAFLAELAALSFA